jgi:hypothetical protein
MNMPYHIIAADLKEKKSHLYVHLHVHKWLRTLLSYISLISTIVSLHNMKNGNIYVKLNTGHSWHACSSAYILNTFNSRIPCHGPNLIAVTLDCTILNFLSLHKLSFNMYYKWLIWFYFLFNLRITSWVKIDLTSWVKIDLVISGEIENVCSLQENGRRQRDKEWSEKLPESIIELC